ncbi:MAG: HD domain-containing protein [Candidatus Gracilibacteria bacterium]|nr:HD domain-containing protein [Candidatus Gracilibacteria bacterium]
MIGHILKLMLTRGLSMKRWNNFPRIEDVSHLDNTGFVIHIALFMIHLEEQNGNKLDKEFIIKRIIFNSFVPLILSDIDSGTKDYIKKVDAEIFDSLEKKSMEFFLSLDAPESIKEDIRNTFYDNSKQSELEIIKAAKKYAGFMECSINEKVFDGMYEVPLKNIEEYFVENRKTIKSLDTILRDNDYRKYLLQIRRLSHSFRWNQEKRIYKISVMSHLVIIAFLAYVIAKIENENGADYNVLEFLLTALYHDIPEAITGDIITPTKKAIPGFEELLGEVEVAMMNDYLFSYISSDYKSEVYEYMLNPFSSDMGKIVKKADIFSALFEAKVELNNGNLSYNDIYRRVKKKTNQFSIGRASYLLKDVLDSFDSNDKGDINLADY